MEDYNKIIEALTIRFVSHKEVSILKPAIVENSYEVENNLLLVNSGHIKFGKDKEVVKPGEVLFIPGGKSVSLAYGQGKYDIFSKEDFLANKAEYLISSKKAKTPPIGTYSGVAFETKAFDSVNFFASLDLPPFKIDNNPIIVNWFRKINDELSSKKKGKDRLAKLYTDIMVIELIRYLTSNSLFVEKFATNTTYFKDARLINLFTYINDNLASDLSNKVLAYVAEVSDDYIGQYFKMLTGINPQDYIEYQRMEQAVSLLRTTKKSIRDIGKEVGYKDTAYFCRRFKMMFGIPAGKMRRRDTLMNV